MSDTFCLRSWNSYLIDLEFLTYRMCCKTSWEPMKLDDDWFNSSSLQERRASHLSGIQHKTCNYCWFMESKKLDSFRLKTVDTVMPTTTTTSKDYGKSVIEIKVGNICNMACRYCGSKNSSIWAERLHDSFYDKAGTAIAQNINNRKEIIDQFHEWLSKELDNTSIIIITGGEPSISPQFYELIEKLDFKNLTIVINSNLNMPEAYMKKFEKVLHKLCLNNTVRIRASLDCIGKQFEWQRQGGDWDLIAKNYIRIGKIPINMIIGQTFTPFSLEGLVPLTKFIAETRKELVNQPKFGATAHIVSVPHQLNPTEWIPSFKNELIKFVQIGTAKYLIRNDLKDQISKWINMPYKLPSIETVTSMRDWLDDAQSKWGGGDWRTIYPKTTSIINNILNNSN